MADPNPNLNVVANITNLDDDDVKLIGYSIVYLKRGDERIVEGGLGSVLIVERMTEPAFVAYLIADWMNKESYQDELAKHGPINAKYLDVDFRVVRRWPRRGFNKASRQVEELEKIARATEEQNAAPILRAAPGTTR